MEGDWKDSGFLLNEKGQKTYRGIKNITWYGVAEPSTHLLLAKYREIVLLGKLK